MAGHAMAHGPGFHACRLLFFVFFVFGPKAPIFQHALVPPMPNAKKSRYLFSMGEEGREGDRGIEYHLKTAQCPSVGARYTPCRLAKAESKLSEQCGGETS